MQHSRTIEFFMRKNNRINTTWTAATIESTTSLHEHFVNDVDRLGIRSLHDKSALNLFPFFR